jgi:hypothetical protein
MDERFDLPSGKKDLGHPAVAQARHELVALERLERYRV